MVQYRSSVSQRNKLRATRTDLHHKKTNSTSQYTSKSTVSITRRGLRARGSFSRRYSSARRYDSSLAWGTSRETPVTSGATGNRDGRGWLLTGWELSEDQCPRTPIVGACTDSQP